ncbi:MAG: response regulator transcription factor [Candidatus Promineifilaceae bacterium]|nr:response regulator transcription factor [Candidatus Promineifilaceae bacterium]
MSEEEKIRIAVVDDHMVVREGLITLLETFPEFELIGEAGSGEEAIEICTGLQPDVILMDLVMGAMGGVEATRIIRERCPETQVLAVTSYKETELVRGVLEAGATGYILKTVTAEELAGAVRAASRGELTVAAEASQVVIEAMTAPPAPGRDLTAREQEVLQLLVEGLSNNEIGIRLDVSPNTVKNHLRSIYSKLNVSSRTAATTLAIKHGLVEVR